MSYADSLRQQAAWIREALDPATPDTQRITLDDIDVDEMDAAAAEIERLTNIGKKWHAAYYEMVKERDEARRQLVSARRAAIEECASHLEQCGFRYSQGFDVPEILRKLSQIDEQGNSK